LRNHILAIESSCDDTSLAIVDRWGRVETEVQISQINTHKDFGGIVPEVASRQHHRDISLLFKQLASQTKINIEQDLKAIAVTKAPGLIGSLLVGSSFAEGLSLALGVPMMGIHHLRGHVCSVFLNRKEELLEEQFKELFPACVLLMSGGHTLLLKVDENFSCQILAETADDAIGECFDKSAKLMGLKYPGGPEVDRIARALKWENPEELKNWKNKFPRPKSAQGFSFSGLKTAVRVALEKNPDLKNEENFSKTIWAIQEAIVDSTIKVLKRKIEDTHVYKNLIVCGGVAMNSRFRDRLDDWSSRSSLNVIFPPLKYCMDNAAMIGAAAWVCQDRHLVDDVRSRMSLVES